MTADALAPCNARASAAMIFTVQNRYVLCLTQGKISTTYVMMTLWMNDINCKYMFMFHLKNLAHKGLRHTACSYHQHIDWIYLPNWQYYLAEAIKQWYSELGIKVTSWCWLLSVKGPQATPEKSKPKHIFSFFEDDTAENVFCHGLTYFFRLNTIID